MTAAWLRTEIAVYRQLSAVPEADFLPVLLAWNDGPTPLLLLEDLSAAHWPPPWEPGLVGRVADLLTRLRRMPPMLNLPALESYRDELSGWRRVADAPAPFPALGLCSASRLAAFPRLQAAEAAARLDGNDFLHLGVRSDNPCFLPGRRAALPRKPAQRRAGNGGGREWILCGPRWPAAARHSPEWPATVSAQNRSPLGGQDAGSLSLPSFSACHGPVPGGGDAKQCQCHLPLGKLTLTLFLPDRAGGIRPRRRPSGVERPRPARLSAEGRRQATPRSTPPARARRKWHGR